MVMGMWLIIRSHVANSKKVDPYPHNLPVILVS